MRILDLDETSFGAFVAGMDAEEQRVFERDIDRYREVCTSMADDYWHWGAHLLLEAPFGDGDERLRRSSLMTLHDPGELLSLKASPVLRQRYLDRLWGMLTRAEIDRYGHLLHVGRLPGGSLPDIAGSHLIQLMDALFAFSALAEERDFHDRFHRMAGAVEEADYEDYVDELGRTTSLVALLRTRQILDDRAPWDAGSHRGSLASMLMTNACLNRCELEDMEYARLETQVFQELSRMLHALTAQGIRRLPLHLSEEAFGDWLLALWGPQAQAEPGRRVLKKSHVARFFLLAEKVVERTESEPLGLAGQLEPPMARKLSCLVSAWSYRNKEGHDSRLPGRKVQDLVSGRALTKASRVPGSAFAHHHRQLMSLVSSRQHVALSLRRLDIYHGVNAFKRDIRGRLRRTYLRRVGVDRWAALYETLVAYMKEGMREAGIPEDQGAAALALPAVPCRYDG